MQRTGGDSSTDSSSSPVQSRGRQLRDAEKDMSRLERRRSSITTKLLASVDHEEQARLGIELETVQKALTSAENLWLALVD
jgi:predicted  nucleic acid-binding Zn-ribbon protein